MNEGIKKINVNKIQMKNCLFFCQILPGICFPKSVNVAMNQIDGFFF